VVSGLFQFTAAADLKLTGDPCVTGSPQLAISDGYWVMLKPLNHGEHVIHFKAGVSAWGPPLDVTYIITIEKSLPPRNRTSSEGQGFREGVGGARASSRNSPIRCRVLAREILWRSFSA